MEKKKTYVLDTTVLIYDPDIFFKLGEVDIIVPLAAIKELDGLKKSEVELTAQAARKIARTLDRWGSYADLVAGVKLPTNSRVYIYTDYDNVDGLESQADNKIVGTALKIKRDKDIDVILITTDTNMRTVARAYGIKAEYMPDMKKEGIQKNSSNYKIPNNMINKRMTFINKGSVSKRSWLILYILTVLITFLCIDLFYGDTFTGVFFGVVIGSFLFLIGYAVYLKVVFRNIPQRLIRGTQKISLYEERDKTELYDVPFSRNPYYDSTNRGN